MPQLKVILHKMGVGSGFVVVDCYQVATEPELVVHRQLEDGVEVPRGAWVITHRRTSFTLGSHPYRTRDLALCGVRRISAAGLKWDFDELGKTDLTEHRRVIEEAYANRFFD